MLIFLLWIFFRGVFTGQSVRFASSVNVGLGSPDHGFEKDRIVKAAGEGNSRDFTYFLLGGSRVIYASAARLALIKVRSSPSSPLSIVYLYLFCLFLCVFLAFCVSFRSSWRA